MSKKRRQRSKLKRLSKRLIRALSNNNVAQLKSLRSRGESFSGLDSNGNTLLHLAIQNQKIDAFEYLLMIEEIPKETFNSYGNSALMDAFGAAQDYVLGLIESGCDIDKIFPDGNTPLHLAIYNKMIKVIELLIERGVDVNSQNTQDETALHVACKVGCVDAICTLLFYGADPNLTYLTEADYMQHTTYSYLSVFDLAISAGVTPEVQNLFINQLQGHDKFFSLMTFIEALECDPDLFQKLLKITCDLNYTYDDLKVFSQRIPTFDSKMFKLFIKEFSYVVEDMFYRCCLDEVFICEDPRFLRNFTENLFTLLGSDIVHSFIEQINDSPLPLLGYLIESFAVHRDELDTLTQLLCCFLSYGVNMTVEAMNELYFSYGYCDLFKMMLHMDITNLKRGFIYKHVLPRIIYDVTLTTDQIRTFDGYDEPTVYKISEYFVLTKLSVNSQTLVPSLVELARNCLREYIIRKFQTKNSRQFYTVLRRLPAAELHKRIISFETKLYSV